MGLYTIDTKYNFPKELSKAVLWSFQFTTQLYWFSKCPLMPVCRLDFWYVVKGHMCILILCVMPRRNLFLLSEKVYVTRTIKNLQFESWMWKNRFRSIYRRSCLLNHYGQNAHFREQLNQKLCIIFEATLIFSFGKKISVDKVFKGKNHEN